MHGCQLRIFDHNQSNFLFALYADLVGYETVNKLNASHSSDLRRRNSSNQPPSISTSSSQQPNPVAVASLAALHQIMLSNGASAANFAAANRLLLQSIQQQQQQQQNQERRGVYDRNSISFDHEGSSVDRPAIFFHQILLP